MAKPNWSPVARVLRSLRCWVMPCSYSALSLTPVMAAEWRPAEPHHVFGDHYSACHRYGGMSPCGPSALGGGWSTAGGALHGGSGDVGGPQPSTSTYQQRGAAYYGGSPGLISPYGARYGGGPSGTPVLSPSATYTELPDNCYAEGEPETPYLDCKLYTSYISLGYMGGTTPSHIYPNLFVPIVQSQTQMLFADVRGLLGERAVTQGTWGGGYRTLLNESVILGGYAYHDYRQTELQNQFQQISFGTELLALNWETRANGYVPVGDSPSNSGVAGTAVIQNGGVFILGRQQTALSGVDGEFGAVLATDEFHDRELRAFVGGYYFNAPQGSQDLPGVSSRLEARLYDLAMLGEGSRIEAGVMQTYDAVRDVEWTGFVNVRIALGRPTCPRSLTPLERRMLDRPIRQVPILTTDAATASQVAINSQTGLPYSSVVFVRPGDDVRTGIEGAPANSLVIVEAQPTSYTAPAGVQLQSGQTVVGAGSSLQVGAAGGQIATLTIPGVRPTIDRANTAGPVLTANTNTAIRGLNLTGGTHAIYGLNTSQVTICDVNAFGSSDDGIHLLDFNGLTLCNTNVTNTGNRGIYLRNINDAVIENASIANTTGYAFYHNCGVNTTLDGLTVDATNVGSDAVVFHTQEDSNIRNITVRDSQHNAIVVGSSVRSTFSNITLENVVGNGFRINQSGTITLENFSATNIGQSAVVIDDTDLLQLNTSNFTNVSNVISYLNLPNNISGVENSATTFGTLFTGSTGGGSILFTTPAASAP